MNGPLIALTKSEDEFDWIFGEAAQDALCQSFFGLAKMAEDNLGVSALWRAKKEMYPRVFVPKGIKVPEVSPYLGMSIVDIQ